MHPEPIIRSLADQDLYKITMAQAFLHHHPEATGVFEYKCRTAEVDLRPLIPAIREQVQALADLRYTCDELAFIGSLGYISRDFIDFLRIFRLNPDAVEIRPGEEALEIRVAGPLVHVTWFEIHLLSIVGELYSATIRPQPDFNEGRRRLAEKIALAKRFTVEHPAHPFRLIEFGTRRRFSRAWQDEVVRTLQRDLPECLAGTSNVDLARRLGLRVFGTHAHEWLQAHQAMSVRLSESQKFAFDIWAREYRGQLGIALSDVINMDAFLADFDLYFAKLFDGARHDSGPPDIWAESLIAHYRTLNIDPATKYAVFSDSLTFPKALDLCLRFEGRIRTSYGIGTNLTNDLGVRGINHVMKLVECNGQPVAKISDEPGKSMCRDETFLAYLRQVFKVRSSGGSTTFQQKKKAPGGGL